MVFAEACDERFVVYDGCGVAECAAFAEDLLAGLFFLVWLAEVNVDVFEFHVVVSQILLGHLAPDAGAERIDSNLVLVIFSWNFRKRHDVSLGMVKVRLILTLLGLPQTAVKAMSSFPGFLGLQVSAVLLCDF